MLMKLFAVLSQWLFPEKCVLCGRLLEKNEMDLCHKCRIEAPECGQSRTKYPYLESWSAVWLYQDLVRRSILRYKFYGKRSYAAAYARLLGVKLMKEDRLQVDLITWVPISAKRLKKRGFDQCQLLAEALSREVDLPAVPLLKKVRDNPPQSGISGQAERRANVLGAYRIVDATAVAEKRILLLDDVITTGATAGECARVLLTGGASQVHFGAVAAARHHEKK
jgi:ComF family protein